ncbi:MAG: hypothetical protein RIB70_07990 [Roseitalea porphyridii]|uniref:RipA family octameric membrane protein n=1 Tax=Roseitalea porphyridii TaxID=1852022 RepID=UPI0032EBAA65
MDNRDLERAWRYHDAADELLNGRIQSFLIAQAFLIVGYAQILTASSFVERIDLKLILLAISCLAIVLTIVMKTLAAQLSRGIRELKRKYLLDENDGDQVYKAYFSAVRGDGVNTSLDGFARGWTRVMPMCFLIFWGLALCYAMFAIFPDVQHLWRR